MQVAATCRSQQSAVRRQGCRAAVALYRHLCFARGYIQERHDVRGLVDQSLRAIPANRGRPHRDDDETFAITCQRKRVAALIQFTHLGPGSLFPEPYRLVNIAVEGLSIVGTARLERLGHQDLAVRGENDGRHPFLGGTSCAVLPSCPRPIFERCRPRRRSRAAYRRTERDGIDGPLCPAKARLACCAEVPEAHASIGARRTPNACHPATRPTRMYRLHGLPALTTPWPPSHPSGTATVLCRRQRRHTVRREDHGTHFAIVRVELARLLSLRRLSRTLGTAAQLRSRRASRRISAACALGCVARLQCRVPVRRAASRPAALLVSSNARITRRSRCCGIEHFSSSLATSSSSLRRRLGVLLADAFRSADSARAPTRAR